MVKEIWSKRKVAMIVGILVLFCELMVFLWQGRWLADEYSHFLTGEGSYNLEGDYEDASVQQTFRARYSGKLDSVGIVVDISEETVTSGSLDLTITDEEQQILWQRTVSFGEEDTGSYLDVPVEIPVRKGEKYCLNIKLDELSPGHYPKLRVCSRDYKLFENVQLFWDGKELEDTQMLMRYHYSDAIPWNKALKGILTGVITAILIIWPGSVRKKYQIGIGLASFIGYPLMVGRCLEAMQVNQSLYLANAMRWNLILMLAIELVFVVTLGSARWGLVCSQIFITVIYSASSYMYTFRGSPLRINDLSAMGTAAKVLGGYDLTPNPQLAMAWGMGLAFIVLSWKSAQTIADKKMRLIAAICGVMLAFAGKYVLINTDFLERRGFYYLAGVSSMESYHIDGYLVGTCFDIKNSKVSKPEGYSSQRVEEILAEYADDQEKENQQYPNIILIMNESFSDLRVLGNLSVADGFMENFYSLQENTIRGYVNVSSIGGGTANSEFEVLTGNSMGLLPASSYAYQQYVSKPIPSMVSTLKEAGYRTYSMHPEEPSNYNRKSVYKYLKFDESLWKSDFQNAQMIHRGVSDRETYHRIEQIYEEKEKDAPVFIFDVTMQNHGGYGEMVNEPEYKKYLLNVDDEEANRYMTLIQESDEAFAELIQYFTGKEDTIICMFGDHQPLLEAGDFYQQIDRQTKGMDETDKILNKYKTPFIIWANYDIAEQQDIDISTNYLGVLLLKTAGINGNPYFNYLEQLMEQYPVITANVYKDSAGNVFQWSGGQEEFPEYRILEYNALFE